MSATQRKTLATQQLVDIVGSNQNAAVTAALEAINERLVWDTALRQRISEKYDELTTLSSASSSKPQVSTGSAPKPVSTTGSARGRTLERLDPYQALEDFGRGQLRAVLTRDTQRRLRTAVEIVQERHPGTKPATKTRIQDMVDYIMEYVVGPGY